MSEALNRFKPAAVTSGRATPDTNGTLKQDYGQSVWAELEGLSLLLCHKPRRTYLSTVDMKSLQALFGGTFDPVHYGGHLKPVETLANLIGLTRVTIIPNNVLRIVPSRKRTACSVNHA